METSSTRQCKHGLYYDDYCEECSGEDIMNFRLTIIPAMERSTRGIKFEFSTKAEMIAASDSCADLLLLLQDKINAMPDYSNIFTREEKIDGEWWDIEED